MAVEAVLHENYVRYMTTLTIVNAIIAVGNAAQGSGEAGKAFKKSLDDLREALIPGEKEKGKRHVEKIKQVLEREAAGGSFKVKPMKADKRVKMKRR